MRSIAIVMAYYDRREQLMKTIPSIVASHHTNYRIIVVDDASPKPINLLLPETEIIRVEPEQKQWVGPVVAFNLGIAHALGADIIVIQNPECIHIGDILMHASDYMTDDNYISFGCWNLDRRDSIDQVRDRIAEDNPLRTDGGGSGWYNHPRWRNRKYHFCAAMTRQTMLELNGFDERFKDGLCYDDDDLVRRVEILEREVIVTDETRPFVVHQWHNREIQSQEKILVNRALYDKIRQEKNYRAQHLVTEDFKECLIR